jgi:hemolysin activation/secretion protein
MKKLLLCILGGISVTGYSADLSYDHCIVSGATVLTEQKIEQIISPFLSHNADGLGCLAAASTLESELREAGAFTAKVYPEITFDQNKTILHVIEGQLSQDGIIIAQPSHRVKESVIQKYLSENLPSGTTLLAENFERAILLTNDLPGIADSEAILFPGNNVGEAKFQIYPKDSKLITGNVYFDNFGSTYTGQNRIGTSLDINSPFHYGDRISLGAAMTDENSLFGYLDLSIPVGADGLRTGIEIDAMSYKTDRVDNLRGDSNTLSAYLTYPIIRSRAGDLYIALYAAQNNMNDKTDLSTITDRIVNTATFKLTGSKFDDFAGGGLNDMKLELVQGHVDLDEFEPYKLEDSQTARTAGQFTRLYWQFSRLQQIKGPLQAYAEIAGQVASKRLDSSQSLAFGGAYDFPGYESGKVLGDEGQRLHIDLRYNTQFEWLGGQQQFSTFYDIGRIKTHAEEIIGDIIIPGIEDKNYTMQSTGLGFSQIWDSVQIQGALGWRINNKIPYSQENTQDDNMHGWVQLVYSF